MAAHTGANISDYTRILKEFYDTGGLHDAIDRELPLLSKFQKLDLDWTGRNAIFAVKVARSSEGAVNSVGFVAEGAALPIASSQVSVQLTLGAKLLYGRFQLTGALMASAKNKAGSFVQALEDEMDGSVDDVKNAAARALYVGGGAIGFVHQKTNFAASVAGGGANDIKIQFSGNIEELPVLFANAVPVKVVRMDNYDTLYTGNAYRPSTTDVGSICFDFAFDTRDATLAPDLADGCGLAVIRTTTPSLADEPTGIYGNMADNAFFGIDRKTTVPVNVPVIPATGLDRLRSCIRRNTLGEAPAGGNPATALSQTRMEAVLTELQEFPFAGKPIDLLVMRPTTRQAYVALISNGSALYTTTDKARHGDVGVADISYNGIRMMTDRHCGRGLILFLNTKSWKLAQLKSASIEDIDGNVLSRIHGFDAYEGHVSWYYNTITSMPNCNGGLHGFDYPGLT